jgi:hypothetical protein
MRTGIDRAKSLFEAYRKMKKRDREDVKKSILRDIDRKIHERPKQIVVDPYRTRRVVSFEDFCRQSIV